MPYPYRRICPICGKPDLLKLSEHLRQVHFLSCNERQSYLKKALFSTPFSHGTSSAPIPSLVLRNNCMETKAYPNFKFKHPCMMMVVGPTQSGKTYFVENMHTHSCFTFPEKKQKRIHWFYNQWQPRYESLKGYLENVK